MAAAWSVAYLGLGIAWLAGAGGYPFVVPGAKAAGFTLLDGLPQDVGALIVTLLAAAGVVVSVGMVASSGRRPVTRRLYTGSAVLLALALAVVVPDYRVLVAVAYTPMVLVGLLVGVVDPGDLGLMYRWPVNNLVLFTVAGLGFGAAAFGYWRRTGAGCRRCGRDGAVSSWTSPQRAARWGQWATGVAIAVPVGYAVTRLAWAVGIPLGLSAEFLASIDQIVYVGAVLGGMAIGGAVLTLGLVQRWGEVFPRWLPWLGGRRVPVGLAVVPAYAVSVLVTSAGLMFIRVGASGTFDKVVPGAGDHWGAWLPEMFWPVWGVALAAAATAYRLRRRGGCATCGRGTTPGLGPSHVDTRTVGSTACHRAA